MLNRKEALAKWLKLAAWKRLKLHKESKHSHIPFQLFASSSSMIEQAFNSK